MTGHLFALQGDLTALACDAWLIPTDSSVRVILRNWSNPRVWALPGRLGVRRGPGVWAGRLVFPLSELYPDYDDPRAIWLGRVGKRGLKPAELRPVLRAFLTQASAAVRAGGGYVKDRARPLLALPLLGTGHGGGRRRSAVMVRALVEEAATFVSENPVDVAMVARTDADHAALQSARRDLGLSWPLDEALLQKASRLARRAAAGQLAIFLGAGVSRGANQPLWWELLAALAAEAGLPVDDEGALVDPAFERLNVLDQAAVLAKRFGGESALREAVCRLIGEHPAYSLAHGLMASLPVREFITTNYDALFERACAATERPVAVLPWGPNPACERWLLKMHGTWEDPASIVLTRASYLRYGARNEALAGIVQAALITRHMMFVGFSLEDDNFHRVVDAVRRAVRPLESMELGEVLALAEFGLRDDLWGEELDWVDLFADDSIHEAARRQEIFLDHLNFLVASSTHLLADRYQATLTPSEKDLRDLLLQIEKRFDGAADRSAPGWRRVRDLLDAFGKPIR